MDTLLLAQEKIGMNMSAMLEARKMGPIGMTADNSQLLLRVGTSKTASVCASYVRRRRREWNTHGLCDNLSHSSAEDSPSLAGWPTYYSTQLHALGLQSLTLRTEGASPCRTDPHSQSIVAPIA